MPEPEPLDGVRRTLRRRGGVQRTLPLLPLRSMVIFPGQVVSLDVGRPRSVAAIREALRHDGLMVVAAQRHADQLEPDREGIYDYGTMVRLLPPAGLLPMVSVPSRSGRSPASDVPAGGARADGALVGGATAGGIATEFEAFRVSVRGLDRVRLVRVWKTPFYRATVRVVPDSQGTAGGDEMAAALLALQRRLKEYAEVGRPPLFETPEVPEELLAHPGWLADLLAARLPLGVNEKQEILEELDPLVRLERVYERLNREIAVARLDQRIQERVREQMERAQKEYYLREQLRAIQRELGEADGLSVADAEGDGYRQRIEQAGMPEEAKHKALQELERLGRMPSISPEAAVIRTYLDWLLAIPWQKTSEDRLDLASAREVLEADHYGLEEAKRRILEFLAVRRLAGTGVSKGPILCLVGPPGVGKTSLARSVARALGRRFVRFSLGGLRDEAEIRGHRRTYVGALPGRIIQALKQAGTRNPVILLDEVDKMGMDFRGDPASALLEVLDPEQNKAFSDHYLEVPVDLSEVLFITTANYLGAIPRPLLDRMETIEIPGYTEAEKFQIGKRYLWPKQLRENGLTPEAVQLSEGALRDIIRRYTREAGVRQLERQLGKLCRRVALHIVERRESLAPGERESEPGAALHLRITRRGLKEYLGAPLNRFGEAELQDRVGVATGLAYTEAGGDILAIEVLVAPGMGRFVLTGKLGEVMRESAQAALSFIRSRRQALGIGQDFPDRLDIHMHIPEGAIPKDGPSAGITIATALASALTGRPVRHDVAMTGEITLRGRILPVGGLREKLLAAVRSGIGTVLVPAENEKDLAEMPAEVKRRLDIRLVREMDEVLAQALLPPPESEKAGDDEARGEAKEESTAAQNPEARPSGKGAGEKAARAG